MKSLYLIFLVLIVIFCCGFSDPVINIAVSYQPNTQKLEGLFKTYLPERCNIIYTKVPRGLIISLDENCFFNKGEARIKESSLEILNIVAELLNKLPNYCVIESHTEENDFSASDYNYNWEISLARSANIVEYLIKCQKVSKDKLFALGFGESMPFADNVSPTEISPDRKNGSKTVDMNNRIDFVILEYEARR